MSEREFDVVVWGATGFTGALVASHLLNVYGAGGNLRWAVGGRSESKLEATRRALGDGGADVPMLLADADDPESLAALARRTRVVCSTVGPYALHGSNLVAACVEQGTHYCDLTGELQWMRRMIDRHHQRAGETGARIVHTCGFDSIPSDLGTRFLQQEMRRRQGRVCPEVRLRVREARGGFSGGTVASMVNMLDEAERDPDVRALIRDPYALNPADQRDGLDGPDSLVPEYDPACGGWVGPFVMGAINTRVVRRSNALAGYPYGRDFRYREGMLMPFGTWGFALAAGLGAGSAAAGAAIGFKVVRDALGPLLPKPGEGPSAQTRAKGRFVIDLVGAVAGHPELTVQVSGEGDPGYASTSRMLGEAAVCLARDDAGSGGGVLTPAVAMGDALIERLQLHAGITFRVVN